MYALLNSVIEYIAILARVVDLVVLATAWYLAAKFGGTYGKLQANFNIFENCTSITFQYSNVGICCYNTIILILPQYYRL